MWKDGNCVKEGNGLDKCEHFTCENVFPTLSRKTDCNGINIIEWEAMLPNIHSVNKHLSSV